MEFYTEEEIRDILKLGFKKCKALMGTEGFPSIKLGQEYRVPVDKFNEWVANTKEFKLNYKSV